MNICDAQLQKFGEYDIIFLKHTWKKIAVQSGNSDIANGKFYSPDGSLLYIEPAAITTHYKNGRRVLVKSNGRFNWINYAGIDRKLLYSKLIRLDAFEVSTNFMDNFRFSLGIGFFAENILEEQIEILTFGARYYLPEIKISPVFVDASFAYNLNQEPNANFFNENQDFVVYNLGILGMGTEIPTKYWVKFEIATGLATRFVNLKQERRDFAGNPVLVEKKSIGFSPYFQFGIKYRITSF